MALQAALHLGLSLGEHAASLGDTGHPHLELLAPPRYLGPPLLERTPRREGLLQLGEGPGQLRLLGRHL